MHVYAQMAPHILDDLISVMSHGMIGMCILFFMEIPAYSIVYVSTHLDRMTSRTSTFLYTEGKCSQLLQALSLQRGTEATVAKRAHVLTIMKGKPIDGYTLCFVGKK